MKSGLVGRNNLADGTVVEAEPAETVSMKSGLVGRNNPGFNVLGCIGMHVVSMKSGLEDRNNGTAFTGSTRPSSCLDEVRPGRPEQSRMAIAGINAKVQVSMKSGLEDRNNLQTTRESLTGMNTSQ